MLFSVTKILYPKIKIVSFFGPNVVENLYAIIRDI